MTSRFPLEWIDTVRAIDDPDTDEATAHRQQNANREHARRNMPPRYVSAETDLDAVWLWVLAVLGDRRTAPSLLLAGPTGTGKTHTGYAALRLLSESRRSTIAWRGASTATFFGELRPRDKRDTEAAFEDYAKVPVLLLDDLGATGRTEWTEETLYRLIDHRYTHCLPSIFTTNVAPANLGERLGERTASRLTEMCRMVPLLGEDRRKPTA